MNYLFQCRCIMCLIVMLSVFDNISQDYVSPYMIVCLYGVLCRRLQSRTDAGEVGASSFTLQR